MVGLIADFLEEKITLEDREAVAKVLNINFNIRDGEPYRPSRQIAQLLLQEDEAQRLSMCDIYMWRALLHYYCLGLRRAVGPPVKRMLRGLRARMQR